MWQHKRPFAAIAAEAQRQLPKGQPPRHRPVKRQSHAQPAPQSPGATTHPKEAPKGQPPRRRPVKRQSHAQPAPQKPRSGCRSTPKEQCGEFAEGRFRCKRKFRRPSATRAAPGRSRATDSKGTRWGPGGNAFRFRPGGFPPLSTGESGLPATQKTKQQQNNHPCTITIELIPQGMPRRAEKKKKYLQTSKEKFFKRHSYSPQFVV